MSNCAPSNRITFSTFRRATDTRPVRDELPWPELATRLTTHAVSATKDGPAWSPTVFGGSRGNKSAQYVTGAVLDLDNVDYEDTRDRFDGLAHTLASSYSHTPESGHLRVVIPFDKPVPAARWADVWHRINERFGGINDPATKDLARLYYWPSHPPGTLKVAEVWDGEALDWESLPAAHARGLHGAGPEPIPDRIAKGQRRRHFISLIGSLRNRHVPEDVILACVRVVNEQHCVEPAPDEHLVKIVQSTESWDPGECAERTEKDQLLANAMQTVWALNEQIADEDRIMADQKQTAAQRLVRIQKARLLGERQARGETVEVADETTGGEFVPAVELPKKTVALRAGVSPRVVDAVDNHDRTLGLPAAIVKAVLKPISQEDGSTTQEWRNTSFVPAADIRELRRQYASMPKLVLPKRLAPEPTNERPWLPHDVCPVHRYAPTAEELYVTCAIDHRPLRPVVMTSNDAVMSESQNLRIAPFVEVVPAQSGTYSYTEGFANWSAPPLFEPPEDGVPRFAEWLS